MKNPDVLWYIVLTLIKGLGPVSQNFILSLCKDIDSCFAMSEEGLLAMAGEKNLSVYSRYIRLFVAQREDKELWKKAMEIKISSENAGICLLTRDDEAYPLRFRGIPDMPVLIYVKGKMMINDFARTAGIIGARRCTHEGKKTAIDIARSLVSENCVVISGMAKGIDSYAQTAALKEKGYTIAVAGNGPDICYPREHQALYEAVCENGCVLSEYQPGQRPRKYMFPRRNRIIAALSDELYVIDVGRQSGTHSTVAAGKCYGKKIHNPRVRPLCELTALCAAHMIDHHM